MKILYSILLLLVLLSPIGLFFFPETNRFEMIRSGGPLLALGILVLFFFVTRGFAFWREGWKGRASFWIPWGVFVSLSTLSFVFAEVKMFGFAEVFVLLLGSLVMMVLSQDRRLTTWLPWLFLATLLLATGVGVFGFLTTDHARFFGFFYDPSIKADAWPNAYASFFLLTFPFALWALYSRSFRWELILRPLLAGFLFAGFVLTLSRGAFLAGFLEVLLSIFILRPRFKTVFIQGILILLFTALFSQSILWFKTESIEVEARLSFSQVEGGNSASERVQFFEGAMKMIKENPWFGTGPSTFKYEYPAVQQGFLALSDHPHNVLFKWGVERGIPAVGAFLVFMGCLFWSGFCRFKSCFFVRIAWIALLGFFAHHMIDYNLNFVTNALFVYFVWAGLMTQDFPSRPVRWMPVMGCFLTFILMLSGFKWALDEWRFNGTSVFNPLVPSWELHEKIDSTKGAERESWVLKQLEINPKDAQAWVWLGALREEMGDLLGAREAYSHAIAVNPKNTFAFYLAYARVLQALRDAEGLNMLAEHLEPLFVEYEELYKKNLHYTQSTSEWDWMQELKKILNEFQSDYVG